MDCNEWLVQVQQVLEGRMQAQSELNSTLKGNCELLEQLLLRSDLKEKKLSLKLAQLNAEKETEKMKFEETIATLKKAAECKRYCTNYRTNESKNLLVYLKTLDSELSIVSFELKSARTIW